MPLRLAARFGALLALAAASLAFVPPAALAANVTLFAAPAASGSGNCSSAANACTLATALGDASDDTSAAVTINLGTGTYDENEIQITGGSESSLTLDGAGVTATDLLANADVGPVLYLDDSPVAISVENMEISHGDTSGDGANMGIDGGTVTLSNVWIFAGISTASGGGLEVSGGTVDIDGSQITGNRASVYGGAIISFGGTLTISDSTVSANQGGAGSAIHAQGTVNVVDSTLASNSGSDALVNAGGAVSVYGSTIAENPYGIDNISGTFALGASVLADNGGTHDCDSSSSAITDDGYNYADDSSCSSGSTFFTRPTSHVAAALNLGALAANGGTTATFAEPTNSAAYDVVPVGTTIGAESQPFCAGTDQRGAARTQGAASACSAGAYQYAPPLLTTSSLPSGQVGTPYSASLAASGTFSPITFALVSGALPPGLSLSSTDLISGTPTSATTATFGVQASDAVGVDSATGTLSIAIAAAPSHTPVIAIDSATAKLQHGKLPVSLSCSTAPCAGNVRLTESVKVKVRHHTKTQTVTLASASYSLAAGQSATTKLTLTAKGRHALAAVAKHHLHETLTATVTGGTAASKRIEVT